METQKYKIRIASTSPEMPDSHVFAQKHCLLGVSMSNPVFWRSSLNTLLNWIDQHFESCCIVVGDYLQRHNERNQKGVGETEAIELALAKGDRFLEHLQQYLPQYSAEKFIIHRWQPFTQQTNFSAKHAAIQHIYEHVTGVQQSIERTIQLFMERKTPEQRSSLVSEEQIKGHSRQYLLEEMAVFSNLIEEGWPVILYPGEQLPVLVEFGRGNYREIPETLAKGIYVELKVIKKR